MSRRGHDGDGDGVQRYRHGWIPISPNYSEANRNSPSDWAGDVDALRNLPSEGEGHDSRLSYLWQKQGFDGKPETVSPSEFDELPAKYVRVYRGLHGDNASQYAEDFRSGDPYPGLGVHGNGTYTATDESVAKEFAALEGGSGEMLNMALRPEAKITTATEAWDEWDRLAARDNTPREVEYAMGGDIGRIATALGYDAVLIDDTGVQGKYYIVLNRTAVIVEDPNRADPDTTSDTGPAFDQAGFMDLFNESFG